MAKKKDILAKPAPKKLPKPLRVPYNPAADAYFNRKRRLRRMG